MGPRTMIPFGTRYSSDQSLLVDAASADIPLLVDALREAAIPGVRNLHPAYTSVLVVYDPLAVDAAGLRLRIEEAARLGQPSPREPRLVEIPARYDGDDLDDVAALHGISPARVAELHSSAAYRVAFLGFVPGFAYLEGLPPGLATPRLSQPRPRVAAGSIGIAGAQTGVYPLETPGGWRLIARTTLELFRTDRDPMALLAIGDRVRFIPI